ncbi:hypothetical protein DMUE_2782 [Dictyocoela muelleri]|nr:hypothetical protein DMUE_2782 [Dictyocoela muelleri]
MYVKFKTFKNFKIQNLKQKISETGNIKKFSISKIMQKSLPSGLSQNIAWTITKGSWLTHIFLTISINTLFSNLFGKNKGLQTTIIVYNIITFIFFHWILGDPFNSQYNNHTFWEQLVEQLDNYSESLLFLGVYPIVLFIICNHLVYWDSILFYLSVTSLGLVLIPKLGCMHLRRVFNLRRK